MFCSYCVWILNVTGTKNEAQVILVSFFSAMVTVMEGVSARPCERSTENKVGIVQRDFLINIVPLPLIKP